MNEHPAIGYCERDLAMFRDRLRRLKSGCLKFGKSTDGVTWVNTTAEDIAFAESRIAEMEIFFGGTCASKVVFALSILIA